LGYFHAQPAQGHPRPAQTHGSSPQVGLMKAVSNLARSLEELVADHPRAGQGADRNLTPEISG
jgi:hypothetical protein